jgi:hypothetical protein
MYGPVSLSGAYPNAAKEIIIYFYDKFFGSKNNFVTPLVPYDFKRDKSLIDNIDKEFNIDDYKSSFKALRKILFQFDVTVPTLYKQYADLCENGGIEFCAYNVDKKFSDCVDSFIFVEIDKIKETQRKRYIQN